VLECVRRYVLRDAWRTIPYSRISLRLGGKRVLAAATALCLGMGWLPVCADDAGAGGDDLNPIIEFLRDQEKTCANILSIEKRDPVVVIVCETSLTDMSSRVTHTLAVDQIGL
jgi:hypothetical protein